MTLTDVNRGLGAAGSDKGDAAHTFAGRSYLDIYETLFGKWAGDAFDLIEIGVMTGGSMRLWSRRFPKARVHGIDINPACAGVKEERVEVTIGSQVDAGVLGAVAQRCRDVRVIVDDGSHIMEHLMTTFSLLWPVLAAHGYYVMEDVGTTYRGVDVGWPGMAHNPQPFPAVNRGVMDAFLMGKVKDMDDRVGDVASIRFSYNLIIFEKA